MKLVRAKIYLLKIATLHPILVELITDEGLVGVGEAGVAYGIGGTAAAGMIRISLRGCSSQRPVPDRSTLGPRCTITSF